MKKTLIALTVSIAALGLAVEAGQPASAPLGAQTPAPTGILPTLLPVARDTPQAPFDEREITPVESAGASRGD